MDLSWLSKEPLDAIFDASTLLTVEESPVSYITQGRSINDSQHTGPLFAIKTACVQPKFSKEPHDIVKELKLIASLSHINIIEILGSLYEESTTSVHFWMPFVQSSLADILDSAKFSPHTELQTWIVWNREPQDFAIVARSLIYQMLSAVAYLHSPDIKIAHRDIKPGNFLLNEEGCIKLIDFGIAWNESISPSDGTLWPEPQNAMCSHVCTGPYRAPETIFGPTTYDPFAVDLWSLGATCAEFFTSLRFTCEDSEEEWYLARKGPKNEQADLVDDPVCPPYRNSEKALRKGTWSRDPLFDASGGSIGLAWNIFLLRGSPTKDNWPTFEELPDATKLNFVDVSPVDLRTRLPNLPKADQSPPFTGDHFPPEEMSKSPLDLIHRLLVYPPERRLSAAQALEHPWLVGDTLYLPPGCVNLWQRDRLQDMLFGYKGYTITA